MPCYPLHPDHLISVDSRRYFCDRHIFAMSSITGNHVVPSIMLRWCGNQVHFLDLNKCVFFPDTFSQSLVMLIDSFIRLKCVRAQVSRKHSVLRTYGMKSSSRGVHRINVYLRHVGDYAEIMGCKFSHGSGWNLPSFSIHQLVLSLPGYCTAICC